MACCYIFFTVAHLVILFQEIESWEQPSRHQYHIQTDEGPERYFRYQTDSGQYRKEKRLEDGTVIGTYAWIDGDGFLRQRDYIADNAGYRILKSKNIFVGRSMNVGDAVKAVKKVPPSSGTLVKSRRPVVTVPYGTAPSTSTYIPPISSTTPSSVISTTPTAVIVSTTEQPVVEITPLAYPKEPSTHVNSVSTYRPPVTTIAPSYYETSSPIPNINYIPDYDQNSLEYNPNVHQINNDYRFQNGPTYPLDRNGKPFSGLRFGNGYDQQYQTYDGLSVTNDGFRYYIPRAYHEEQTEHDGRRDGSFGYIDPFGIRRVIYYNTAPGGGFQHRKNNRYVGFDATPYDPRPY